MKNAKKVFAIALAAFMLFSLSIMAFAVDTYSISVATTETGHTYTAYQVFTGDLSGSTLSNIVWGSDINGAAFLAALKADTTFGADAANDFASCTTAAEVAAVIGQAGYNPAKMKQFAEVALANIAATNSGWDDDSTEAGHGNEATTYVISDLNAGYYLVTDELADESVNEAESALILKVTDSETIYPKENFNPTFDKNITTATGTAEGVADRDVDTDVEYNLVATLPSNLGDYASYKLNFFDTLDSGLSLKADTVKVYNGSTEITSATGVTVNTDPGAGTLAVYIADVKATGIEAVAGDVIRVTYKATVNSEIQPNANNVNEAYIQYSHDPRNVAEYSVLPPDDVYVWTFQLNVTKQFSDDQDHTAGFTLYKIDADDNEVAVEAEKTVTVNNGPLSWADLSDGHYVLKETTVPEGFNRASDTEFTVVTTVNSDGTRQSISTGNANVSANASDGTVAVTIVNNTGSTLPSTGGIGTTIFYIVGSLLVVGALVFIVSKRRMQSVSNNG